MSGNKTRKWSSLTLVTCIFGCMLLISFGSRILIYLFSLTPKTYEIVNVYYPTEDKILRFEDILKFGREKLVSTMRGFNYTEKMIGLTFLTPETDGRPFQSVILSTWRTGSTFFGEILNAMPGNYHFSEPLQYMGNRRIHGPPESIDGIHTLRQLLRCNYSGLIQYFDGVPVRQLAGTCDVLPKLCTDPHFLNRHCKMYPFQSAKLVRVPAEFSEPLLTDPELNVKIVLLIRDPRGIMASRKNLDWCQSSSDCENTSVLCENLISDYKAAGALTKKYPSRLKVIRYEDLSLNPYDVTKEILDFYGFPFDHNVIEYLDAHTKEDLGNLNPTARNSKMIPFNWIYNTTLFSFAEIQQIQTACSGAMSLWGYKNIDDELTRNTTNVYPMVSFSFATEDQNNNNNNNN